MKHWLDWNARRRSNRWLAAIGVFAVLFGAVPKDARGDGRSDGNVGGSLPPPPPSPPAAAGDETVGTLPAVSGGLPFTRAWDDPHAAMYVEGRFEDVWSALVGVQGGTNVTVQMLDPRTRAVRLVFHGRMRLLLDRHVLQSTTIEIGIGIPQMLGPASASVGLVGTVPTTSPALPGYTTLPVRALDASGALMSVPLRTAVETRSGLRTTVDIASGREIVSLTQMH